MDWPLRKWEGHGLLPHAAFIQALTNSLRVAGMALSNYGMSRAVNK